jgi:dienelactone hydrolase
MFRKALALLILFASASCAGAASTKPHAATPAPAPLPSSSTSPALWAGLEPGPLKVGFKAWDIRLQAADFPRGPQHLIQMDVWYPIIAGTGTPMTFRDYVTPRFIETHYVDPTDQDLAAAVADWTSWVSTLGIPAGAANQWLNSPVYARYAGTPPPNKLYPVIGICPDAGQTLSEQAILGEYFASFGFIVVTTPSMTRFDPLTPDRLTALQEEQQDDFDRAVSQIGYWPSVVDIPVSIIGYGFGADAVVLYAMHLRQPTNAVVLLDPQFTPERIAAMKASTMWEPAFHMPAFLEIYAGNPDLAFSQSLNTQSFSAERGRSSMKHIHFTSVGFAAAAFPDIARATGAGPDIRNEVKATATAIRSFIEKIWAPTRPPI